MTRETRKATTLTRLATIVAATVALFVAGGTIATSASAATQTVQFQRLNTKLCVTENVSGNPQLFEGLCNATNARQRWFMFNQVGHPGAKFTPQSVSTVCLNVQDSSRSVGAKIVLSGCASDLSQDWRITSTPNFPAFLIENVNSHLCMTRTSVALVQQPCSQNLLTQNFALNGV